MVNATLPRLSLDVARLTTPLVRHRNNNVTTRFDVPIGVLPPSFMTNPKLAQR